MIGLRRRPLATALALLLSGLGCDDSGADASEVVERARPHIVGFVSFDGWARRVFGAEAELAEAARLEETLFAPIRREGGVLSAEVVREGVHERRLALRAPEAIAPEARFVDLRGMGEGDLSAALVRMDDPRGRGRPEVQALVIRRRRSAGVAATLEVRVAYAPSPSP